MAEASRFWFTYHEVATALIKQQDIRDGIWAVSCEFGLAAITAGPDDERLAPTAMVPVRRIGLVKVEELGVLSVDASVVNPPPTRSKIARKNPSGRVA